MAYSFLYNVEIDIFFHKRFIWLPVTGQRLRAVVKLHNGCKKIMLRLPCPYYRQPGVAAGNGENRWLPFQQVFTVVPLRVPCYADIVSVLHWYFFNWFWSCLWKLLKNSYKHLWINWILLYIRHANHLQLSNVQFWSGIQWKLSKSLSKSQWKFQVPSEKQPFGCFFFFITIPHL